MTRKQHNHCPGCGLDLTEKPSKVRQPRSVPQHRRYFALIRAAFNHWPERHELKPQSEEHLRKWLQAKAGHRVVETVDTAGMAPEQGLALMVAQINKAGPFAFHRSAGTRFYSITSASIDFDTLPHLAACALFDDVAEVIETETGIRCEDMITHTPRSKPHRIEVAA